MKVFYFITLHVINLIFLAVFSIVAVAFFANPSAGSSSPFNPVVIGMLVFLLLSLIVIYVYELKKGKWITLLIGSVLYIVVFILTLLVIFPYLYRAFGYN